MRLLILGGTRFLGQHLVTAALARDHEVTLFHRGHNPGIAHARVDTIYGDRRRTLAPLRGRRWDAVIDTSGYHPHAVRASAVALAEVVQHYTFVSTASVYTDYSLPRLDETAPVATLTSAQWHEAESIDTSGNVSAATYGRLYGPLKVLCEQAAEEVFPGRVLIVRPGLLVGPQDYTDRFTYWVTRVARGGEVLAPGRPHRGVQLIDTRDVATWIIAMVEHQHSGLYNVTSWPPTLTMEALLNTCRAVSGADARFTWVSEPFLHAAQVSYWTDMPLWIPEDTMPNMQGLMALNCEKATAAGLHCRPLHETVRDTLQWYVTQKQHEPLGAGIAADREQDLLRRWHDTARAPACVGTVHPERPHPTAVSAAAARPHTGQAQHRNSVTADHPAPWG